MAIKNVVFDFGGVLVGYDPETYLKGLYGDAPAGEYILRNLFDWELVGRLDLGLCSRKEAYAPVLKRAWEDGFGEETEFVAAHWVDDIMGTMEDTAELIRKLRASGVRVYYLTNMPEDLWEIFTARGLRDIFDGGVASFAVHVTKPDERIYRLLLEEYGLVPEETVFIDDMERNIKGAQALGIRGILFRGAEGVRRDLEALGVDIKE